MSDETFFIEQEVKKLKRKVISASSNSTLNTHTASAIPLTTEKVDLIGMVNEVNANVADKQKKYCVDVKDFGAKGDGTTDDTVAIQNAVNSVYTNGGGVVLLPKGVYKTTLAIQWKSKVSLMGMGMGVSIIRPIGVGFSAIEHYGGSVTTPLVDCIFKDFEIDGSLMGDITTPYTTSEKGIFITFMTRPKFINIYIHETPATGFGCDFLQDAMFLNCIANHCGRNFGLNGGAPSGASGFGIGTGQYYVENVYMFGCTANNNGNHGIFFEVITEVGDHTYTSKGAYVFGCTANGNRTGICDKGVDEMRVIGCIMEGNSHYGYETRDIATGGLVESCTIRGNLVGGISLGYSFNGYYTIRGNSIYENTNDGIICTETTTDVPHLTVANNKIYSNGATGVFIGGKHSNLLISNNEIYSNVKHGIKFVGVTFINPKLANNRIYSNGTCGITLVGATTDLSIENNEVFNNGTSLTSQYQQGMYIGTDAIRPRIKNNSAYDSQATKTQTHGLQLLNTITITGGYIKDNDFVGNLTSALDATGTITGGTIINRNAGYTPSAGTVALTPTASPWTYTLGVTDSVLYLVGTGISVSIGGGVPIFSGVTQATVPCQAGKSLTITYTTLTSSVIRVMA